MPRGTKVAVTQKDRQGWLEKLETGKGITEIARTAHRDIRIVKDHIETAREERQKAEVKREFLLGILRQHQNDLLAEVGRLRHLVNVYPRPQITPGDTTKLMINEALKEHLKRSPLLGLLESYENAVEENIQQKTLVRNQLKEKEGEIVSTLPEDIVVYPWTKPILDDLESGLLKDETAHREYIKEKHSDGRYEVRYRAFSLTKGTIAEIHIEAVINAHKQLILSALPYHGQFDKNRQHLKDLANPIKNDLDILTVRRVIPRKCRYCPI